MREAANVNAVRGKVHRPQLHVSFQEEAVLIPRDLQQLRDVLITAVRHDAGREHHQIGFNPDFPFQKRRVDGYVHAGAVLRHLGPAVFLVAQEDDSLFPRFGIICLPKTVGADVPVEDIHIRVGILLLDLQGVLDCLATAHARAIGPLLVARSHTLDHDDVTRNPALARIAQPGFQIQLCYYVRAAVSIAIFRGLVFAGARRDNDHPVIDRPDGLAVGNRGLETADGPLNGCDAGVGKQVNILIALHLSDEAPQLLLRFLAVQQIADAPQISAQLRFSFH